VADPRRALGAAGEDVAAAWYERRGYEIVARNWRCRDGELDLIVRAGRTYVFCEVKTRRSNAFGAPVEAVTRDKQMRIRRLAARWLEDGAPGPAKDIRFDVASVTGPKEIDVVEGAF
jgi:putative endonuclease